MVRSEEQKQPNVRSSWGQLNNEISGNDSVTSGKSGHHDMDRSCKKHAGLFVGLSRQGPATDIPLFGGFPYRWSKAFVSPVCCESVCFVNSALVSEVNQPRQHALIMRAYSRFKVPPFLPVLLVSLIAASRCDLTCAHSGMLAKSAPTTQGDNRLFCWCGSGADFSMAAFNPAIDELVSDCDPHLDASRAVLAAGR